MGWNSWNKFGCDIEAARVRRTAYAMVGSGMKELATDLRDVWKAERCRSQVLNFSAMTSRGTTAHQPGTTRL